MRLLLVGIMFAKNVICVGSIFLVCIVTADGNVTIAPSNIAVVAGDRMDMECRTTNESYVYMWELKRPNITNYVKLFTTHDAALDLACRHTSKLSPRFGYDMDERCSGMLYTNTTSIQDAGMYVCRCDRNTERDSFIAHLTVLESEPYCETNYTVEDNSTLSDGDIIRMQCSVNFRGMWAPSIEWKQHMENEDEDGKEGEGDQLIELHAVSTETVFNSRVTSTLIYVSGSSKATYFTCRVFFKWYNFSMDIQASRKVHVATNLPNFTYTWTSPRLVPHRAQLETTEEVYVAPLPVEVELFSTTTVKTNGNKDWYIIALLLLATVLIFVTLLVGLGIRRCVRHRRGRGISMTYNASASSTVPVHRLERPSSGEYDLTPTATPNIYDRIDGADANDDVTCQAMASHNPCDLELTQCYNGLMVAMANVSSPYDTLDLYEKMDPLNSETDPTGSRLGDGSIQVSEEERYTTPVPRKGFSASSNNSSSDYLEMVGAKKKPTTKVPAKRFVSQNDSNEENYPDGKGKTFANDSEDYLQPGSKALDN